MKNTKLIIMVSTLSFSMESFNLCLTCQTGAKVAKTEAAILDQTAFMMIVMSANTHKVGGIGAPFPATPTHKKSRNI